MLQRCAAAGLGAHRAISRGFRQLHQLDCAIARNAAVDRARRLPPRDTELAETISAPDAAPEQLLLRQERQQALYAALRKLTGTEQVIFYRKYYYRQSTAQIAAELGSTVRAVEGRLYLLKGKLCRELGGDFYE